MLMRQMEDQKAEIERMQIENEEEKAVLESGLDETLLELATLRDGQGEKSAVLQERLDQMMSSHKRKMQQILGELASILPEKSMLSSQWLLALIHGLLTNNNVPV